MAENVNTTSVVAPVNKIFSDKLLIEDVNQIPVWSIPAQVIPVDSRQGKVVNARKYCNWDPDTDALTEGTVPDGLTLDPDDETFTLYPYGNVVYLSKETVGTNIESTVKVATKQITKLAAETVDLIMRDAAIGGSSVYRAGGAGSRAGIEAGVTLDEIEQIVEVLMTNKAEPFESMSKGSTTVGSVPIDSAYLGITHTRAFRDIKGLTGFVPVQQYANHVAIHPYEKGMVGGVRWIFTPNAKQWETTATVSSTGFYATGGSGYNDVFAACIFGKDAFCKYPFTSETAETLIKNFGSAGVADPLDQKMSIGYYLYLACGIVDDSRMYRYEFLVSSNDVG